MHTQVPVEPGQVLAGKYRVERVLGAGGMGVVVAARHVDLHELVALKFVLPEHAGKPEVVARFLREARASVKIRSEHVARVSDVGRLESGAPYMVMEYLEGTDLAQRIATARALDIPFAVQVVLQASEAVAEAHSLGIIHRDLKPSNLFLEARPDGIPHVKVLDFGISKMAEPGMEHVALTRTSAVLGSPLYMAPEQMTRPKDADPRVDVWALGVILYEMLAGRPPFTGETVPEVCARIASEPHSPLGRPDVPPALSMAIDRCLAKRPGDRFQSVVELAQALAPFGPPDSAVSLRRITALSGRSHAQAATTAAPMATSQPIEPPAPAPNVATAGSWVTPAAATGRKRMAAAIGIGVGASLVLAAIFLVVHSKSSTSSPAGTERASAEPATTTTTTTTNAETTGVSTPSASTTGPAASSVPSSSAHVPTTHPSAHSTAHPTWRRMERHASFFVSRSNPKCSPASRRTAAQPPASSP